MSNPVTPDIATAVPQPRRYSTNELFVGDSQVLIQHGEQTYRLRITRNQKLILTK